MQKCSAVEIVAEARTWVGTPYVHQHRLKHHAVDCVGLILGVGCALDIVNWTPQLWAPFAAYSRKPDPIRMRRGMHLFLDEQPDRAPAPGLIVWLQWRENLPMHLGIIGELEGRLTLIHAYQGVDKCTEHGFVLPWPDRVESVWKFPGMED